MNQNTIALGRAFTRLFPDFLTARALLSALFLSAALLAAIPPAAAAEQEIPKVNLNNADLEALQYLPGIGLVKAEAIIHMRNERKGGFKDITELLDVRGIAEKIFIDIEKHGTLNGGVTTLTEEMRENRPGKSVTQNNAGKHSGG